MKRRKIHMKRKMRRADGFLCGAVLAVLVMLLTMAFSMRAEAAGTGLNKRNITMIAGTEYTLELQGASENAAWSTSKKSVVRIEWTAYPKNKTEDRESGITKTSDGRAAKTATSYAVIRAKKAGTAKISVKDGGRKYTCRVKVVSSRLLNKKKTLKSGQSFTIKVRGKRISKWQSSDGTVASVSRNGKVTARRAGKAVITGTIGVSKLKCTVYVKAERWDKLLEQYAGNDDVRQLVFVKYTGGTKARVEMYNKTGGTWNCILECQGYVGKKGIGKKKEGDKKTPTGVFNLTDAFGIKGNPGTALPYIDVNESLYWCADKKYYNQLIDIREKPHKCKGEHLADYVPQYNYGITLDYNKSCTYKKGSAIFLHCKGKYSYTAGCIAVSQKNMVKIMRNTEPGAKICIYKK